MARVTKRTNRSAGLTRQAPPDCCSNQTARREDPIPRVIRHVRVEEGKEGLPKFGWRWTQKEPQPALLTCSNASKGKMGAISYLGTNKVDRPAIDAKYSSTSLQLVEQVIVLALLACKEPRVSCLIISK